MAGALGSGDDRIEEETVVEIPDDPRFPFTFEDSWLLPEGTGRGVGLALLTATVVASAALAFGVWGLFDIGSTWPAITLAAAFLSTLVLVAFWDGQLVLGVIINAGMAALALTQPGWLHAVTGA